MESSSGAGAAVVAEYALLIRRLASPCVGICMETASSLGRPDVVKVVASGPKSKEPPGDGTRFRIVGACILPSGPATGLIRNTLGPPKASRARLQ